MTMNTGTDTEHAAPDADAPASTTSAASEAPTTWRACRTVGERVRYLLPLCGRPIRFVTARTALTGLHAFGEGYPIPYRQGVLVGLEPQGNLPAISILIPERDQTQLLHALTQGRESFRFDQLYDVTLDVDEEAAQNAAAEAVEALALAARMAQPLGAPGAPAPLDVVWDTITVIHHIIQQVAAMDPLLLSSAADDDEAGLVTRCVFPTCGGALHPVGSDGRTRWEHGAECPYQQARSLREGARGSVAQEAL